MIIRFHTLECRLFRNINRYFDKKQLNIFFRIITHCGGATFTISTLLLLIIFGSQIVQLTAIAAAISLVISYLPVAFFKKKYPRKRPYLVLERVNVIENPLKDCSFPSGHTTAIFSILVPFVLLIPTAAIVLITLGIIVGLSRIYLGLHYPSDVLAGMLLGSSTGILSFLIIKQLYPLLFI